MQDEVQKVEFDDFFKFQMERLRTHRNWAAAFQDLERIQRIKDRVRSLPRKSVTQAFTEVMGEHKIAPSDAEIFCVLEKHAPKRQAPPASRCDACNEHGYGIVEDKIAQCTCCAYGRSLSPEYLAQRQRAYDAGRQKFRNLKDPIFRGLPYGKGGPA